MVDFVWNNKRHSFYCSAESRIVHIANKCWKVTHSTNILSDKEIFFIVLYLTTRYAQELFTRLFYVIIVWKIFYFTNEYINISLIYLPYLGIFVCKCYIRCLSIYIYFNYNISCSIDCLFMMFKLLIVSGLTRSRNAPT